MIYIKISEIKIIIAEIKKLYGFNSRLVLIQKRANEVAEKQWKLSILMNRKIF